MELSGLDWGIILGFFAISLLIGIVTSKQAGNSFSDFFLSGRNMPWWLLGVSMVATTFSADTPNLVTDIVRNNGVSGNWVWWAFLLTGMLTVFVYAKLWRRSGVLTDLEFYEIRYSGNAAAFLRGFRAIYLGVFFNVMIMATVCLAAIKIGAVLLNMSPLQTILIASVITVAYSSMGGLKGVIFTDFFQFMMAMVGTVGAAYYIVNLPQVGGMEALLSHPEVIPKLNFLPDFNDTNAIIPFLILPLAVQWWSVWYPGAEPGGGGYIAQRMLSAKNESHAVGATLLFNVVHYAARPWPWILVGLASLIVFPMQIQKEGAPPLVRIHQDASSFLDSHLKAADMATLQEMLSYETANAVTAEKKAAVERLASIVAEQPNALEVRSLAYICGSRNNGKAIDKRSSALDAESVVSMHLANPSVPVDKLGQDLGYPAMLAYLPKGLLGLLIASLIAAFMSTISTHLNWGSSYIVHDFYHRFVDANAEEKTLVNVGRWSTVLLMILAAGVALLLSSALGAFQILLQIGAGTGLLFILRWFWWRINAWSEVSAMVISFAVAIAFQFSTFSHLADWEKLVYGVAITTVGWIVVTFFTRPTESSVLLSFYKRIKPQSTGWQPVIQAGLVSGQLSPNELSIGQLPKELASMMLGVFMVYGALFGIGYWVYGQWGLGAIGIGSSLVIALILARLWLPRK